jgi:hypothetical protein
MTEDYAAKMARKTLAELHQYVTGRAQYREDAVLAALDELTRRGQSHPEEAHLRPELEREVRQQTARAEKARQQETEATANSEAVEAEAVGPALYSPSTVTLFSVVFSMLAGGALMALNFKALRQTGATVRLVFFVIAYLVVGGLILQWLVQRYGLNPWFGAFFDLPAIVVYIFWFWPRYVGAKPYQSRSWLLPFAICAAIKIGLSLWAIRFLPQLLKAIPGQ